MFSMSRWWPSIALVVVFGACGPEDATSGGETDPSVAVSLPADDPFAGFDAELDALVPTLLEGFDVPGAAVGVLRDGRVLISRGYGLADVASGRPVDDGAAFNIGSISKTVASWGVLKLVEAGEIDLDAPVETYLTRWHLPESEFDNDRVTVRRLLSHTAGLSLHGYPGFQPGEPLPTIEESLSGATNGVGAVYVAFEPGTRWEYSGGGFTIAQLIVEEVTGRPFAEYMRDEVLVPLGMTSSSYVWDDMIDRIAATPYDADGEPIPGPRFTAAAAAGLQTTLHDFLRFARASVRRLDGPDGTAGLLSPETLAMMQSPVAPAEDYGLGYSYNVIGGVTVVGHGGANDGWMAVLGVVPESGDGVVVMTNGTGGAAVHRPITCAFQLRETGEACRPAPGVPVPVEPAALVELEGRYAIDGGMVFELHVRDGRLVFELDDGQSAGVWASAPDEYFLGAAPIRMTVERDATGGVTALEVTQGTNAPERAVRQRPS